ncbi:hypothetical protein A9R05_41855 (plasmid) [Burkholderia sp. KK1]|uniref:hypothetical protein n=1 Tax=Burkholderia sp. M701 TaxID=326454 RepID=UPI0009799455|nr:hypothetical protein [Burkholderia sp. M701]AQH05571.1 hypothetical protein A9R05_41855 [Burkholderia sp. KK1]
MEDKTKQMLAFAAIPAVAIIILAQLLRAVTGTAMADLVFWAAISFGGTGALMGFISGRISNAAESNLARVSRTAGSRSWRAE